MEMLTGDNIGKLPFRGLKKVADLIYYEGPILSHFRDEFNKDILFYWVDYDNTYNRWLVVQITEFQLYKYLLSKSSLLDIFKYPVNDIVYTVEIADSLEYNNITQIINGDIPASYMPEANSFFSLDIPTVYNKILEYQETEAIEFWKSIAFYLKAIPKSAVNHGLVSAITAGNMLSAYGKSFKELVSSEARKEFDARGITAKKRIKDAIDNLLEYFQPNIVNSKIASFGVALIPNDLSDTGETFLTREWKQAIFEKFKNDVIQIDNKSLLEVDEIINSFSRDVDISKIYKPIIELYNDKDITIDITDSSFATKRSVKRISKEIEVKLTSSFNAAPPKVESLEYDRFGLIKVDEKGNPTKKPPTIFEFDINSAWLTDQIVLESKSYKLTQTLLSRYSFKDKVHFIENDMLGIFASGEEYTETIGDFYRQFDELYNRYKDIMPETAKEKSLKAILQILVESNETEKTTTER